MTAIIHTAIDDDFVLSDLDTTMPDSLVTPFLIYPLQQDQDRERIIRSFREGLDYAVKQLPVLAAKICFYPSKKPQKKMASGSLDLNIRTFGPGEHRSYQQMAETAFAPYEFDRQRLLPSTAFTETVAKPVAIVQINFIPGGFIVAPGFNHILNDMKTIDMATTLICQCTKACLQGLPLPEASFNYDRQLFAACTKLCSLSKQELASELTDYRIVDSAMPPSELPSKEVDQVATKGVMYRVEGSTVHQLKNLAQPLDGVSYVSTYDCVVGILWRSITRARQMLHPCLRDKQSRFLHPVDIRYRPQQNIPENYFGNAVAVATAGPVSIPSLIGSSGLSIAASHVRKSIQQVSRDSVAAVSALGTKMAPTEGIFYRPQGLAEKDFLLSSWHSVDIAAWDWGIGPASAVRTWELPMTGCAVLFPDCQRKLESRTYDLYVMLPQDEQDLLSKDEEFRRWFHIL
ncbi:hypothetical protein KCV07_g10093, partial [Aureobasidium melanogenum]